MRKEIILTPDAPAPIGPYSQAIKVGNFVFTAGQLPIDPKTNQVNEASIEGQTRQALINLRAILEKAGSSLNDVVKTTVYLKDLNDFQAMNNVYGEFFAEEPAARSAIEAARLPKDVKVVIDAIAFLK